MPQRQTWTAGQVLTAAQMTQLQDTIWVDDIQNDATTARTLVLADAGKIITMSSASASTLTIPINSSVAFAIGTNILVAQTGAGAVTIASSATINNSYQSLTMSQWSVAQLVKIDTDSWIVENLHQKLISTNAQTGTTYTLVRSDASKLIEISNTSSITLTIPTNTSVPFPVGTSFDILQTNTGQITVAGFDGSVTVNATPGLKLRTQWSSASLIKRATNTWVLLGDLSA